MKWPLMAVCADVWGGQTSPQRAPFLTSPLEFPKHKAVSSGAEQDAVPTLRETPVTDH